MSSAPAHTSPPRPRRHFQYRNCIECRYQFMPEQESQVMCRLCQVRLSARPQKPERISPVTCCGCGATFRPRVDHLRSPMCSTCRNAQRVRERAKAAVARLQPRHCLQCGTEFIPNSGVARYCSEEHRLQAKYERRAARKKEIGL